MKTPDHFLITGTGRCGTGYVSRVLTEAGIPTGHEYAYVPGGFLNTLWWDAGMQGDCSWLGAADPRTPRVVWLARHPYLVFRSLVGMRFFYEPVMHHPYSTFVFEHNPSLAEIPPLEASAEFVIYWTQTFYHRREAFWPLYRIEDSRYIKWWEGLNNDLGLGLKSSTVDGAMRRVNTDYNHRPQADESALEMLDPDTHTELANLAMELGYEA